MNPFGNPELFTNEELEAEIEALNRTYDEVMADDEVPLIVKQALREHAQDVEREARYRDNEEWIYPLTSFELF